jgi:hypothetical protein
MSIIMKLNKVAEEIRELISQRQQELGLTFEEEDHIYTMNGKKDYPSVSKVLKKFYTRRHIIRLEETHKDNKS